MAGTNRPIRVVTTCAFDDHPHAGAAAHRIQIGIVGDEGSAEFIAGTWTTAYPDSVLGIAPHTVQDRRQTSNRHPSTPREQYDGLAPHTQATIKRVQRLQG